MEMEKKGTDQIHTILARGGMGEEKGGGGG